LLRRKENPPQDVIPGKLATASATRNPGLSPKCKLREKSHFAEAEPESKRWPEDWIGI